MGSIAVSAVRIPIFHRRDAYAPPNFTSTQPRRLPRLNTRCHPAHLLRATLQTFVKKRLTLPRLILLTVTYNPPVTEKNTLISESTPFTSRKFRVVRRTVATADGRPRDIDIIRHPGAVVILPLLSDDEIVMIRNFRYTLDRDVWELPAGTLDVPGESSLAAARRELEEEAGYRAQRLEALCVMHASPGFLDEQIEAFVATDLARTQQALEPTERITVETVKLHDALEMCQRGDITDAKTQVALFQWRLQRDMKAEH